MFKYPATQEFTLGGEWEACVQAHSMQDIEQAGKNGELGDAPMLPSHLVSRVLEEIGTDMLWLPRKNTVQSVQYLENGACTYNDMSHPEYCTPECTEEDSPLSKPIQAAAPVDTIDVVDAVVASTIAGERIFTDMFSKALGQFGIGSYRLTKRTLNILHEAEDGRPRKYDTIGIHRNFGGVKNEGGIIIDDEHTEPLSLYALFAAVGPLILGAGAIYQPEGGVPMFIRSQKEPLIRTVYSEDTVLRRPLVNLRNESLAGPGRFRFHVSSGEGLTLLWSELMAYGLGSVVVKMMNAGIRLNTSEEDIARLQLDSKYHGLRFGDSHLLKLLRFSSRDLTLKKTVSVPTRDGERLQITPLDGFELLLQKARALHEVGEFEFSKRELWSIYQGESAIAALRTNDQKWLQLRINWALRQRILNREKEKLDKEAYDWSGQELREADMIYDTIASQRLRLDPDSDDSMPTYIRTAIARGSGWQIRQKLGLNLYGFDASLIDRAMREPLTAGRARMRAAVIKKYGRTSAQYNTGLPASAYVSWSGASIPYQHDDDPSADYDYDDVSHFKQILWPLIEGDTPPPYTVERI